MRQLANLATLLAAAAVLAPGPVGAQSKLGIGPGAVEEVTGSFSDSIPIEVPPFHDIEPHLALSYNSSGGNGYVGVGWSLSAFHSNIERVAAGGRGAPTYTSSDSFVLDGELLLACTAGSPSPSCTTCPSGSQCYSTRIESYARIAYSPAADTWTLTRGDGTTTTYAPTYAVSLNNVWITWRYGVRTVVDTKGNTVNYNWSVNQFTCCWDYPDSIAYNGTLVKLYWESRPDVESYANGVAFDQPYGRLKTIDVTVSGSRARAYKLTYSTSASTSRSVLASVQQFGKDAVLDGSGTVTGGTAMPPTTMRTTPGETTFQWSNWNTTYDQQRAGYYNIGRLTTESDPSGAETVNYNALGLPLQKTRTIDGTSYSSQLSYDAGGRLKGELYPDGDTIGVNPSSNAGTPIGYDSAGRLKTIPGVIDNAIYGPDGQITQYTHDNRTTTAGRLLTTTLAYSPQRQWLTQIQTTTLGYNAATATPLQNLQYTRDKEGETTSVTSPFCSEGWSYAYDELHRLSSGMNQSDFSRNVGFAYDAIGNITNNSKLGAYSYAAGKAHAVSQAGSSSYSYDADGNMTSRVGTSVTWDGNNLPTNINGTSFAYDADGMRLKKVTNGTTTYYLGDDYEVTNGVVTKYFGLSVGKGSPHLLAKRVGTTTYWIHSDQEGSVNVVTDGSGAERLRRAYNPYGDTLSSSSSFTESRGYTAQRQDETGLLYLHARYYDPQLGRFISADPTVPVSSTVGLNRYAYGADDPVDNTDTEGLSPHHHHIKHHFKVSTGWHVLSQGSVRVGGVKVTGTVSGQISVEVLAASAHARDRLETEGITDIIVSPQGFSFGGEFKWHGHDYTFECSVSEGCTSAQVYTRKRLWGASITVSGPIADEHGVGIQIDFLMAHGVDVSLRDQIKVEGAGKVARRLAKRMQSAARTIKEKYDHPTVFVQRPPRPGSGPHPQPCPVDSGFGMCW